MATVLSPSELFSTPQNLKCWTVADYHRLSELGLLAPNERTELLAGQITIMAAKGTPHVTTLQLLAIEIDSFLRALPFYARTQDPVQLDDFSEPEPDLVIVRGQVLDYAQRHPNPEDICLVVEVADSTLQHDCQGKDKAYARSNINEYWVIDLQNQQLHVFQSPTLQGYSSHLILTQPNQISPIVFPELVISLEDIFPPNP